VCGCENGEETERGRGSDAGDLRNSFHTKRKGSAREGGREGQEEEEEEEKERDERRGRGFV